MPDTDNKATPETDAADAAAKTDPKAGFSLFKAGPAADAKAAFAADPVTESPAPKAPPVAPAAAPAASAPKDGPKDPEPTKAAQAASPAASEAPAYDPESDPIRDAPQGRWHPDGNLGRLPPAARPCRQGG